jgi:hypothetical protein
LFEAAFFSQLRQFETEPRRASPTDDWLVQPKPANEPLKKRRANSVQNHYAVLARELVSANVDVIVAAGPTVDAGRSVTSKIPVVRVGGAMDPVEEGFVASLAALGGNITGDHAPTGRSCWQAPGTAEAYREAVAISHRQARLGMPAAGHRCRSLKAPSERVPQQCQRGRRAW